MIRTKLYLIQFYFYQQLDCLQLFTFLCTLAQRQRGDTSLLSVIVAPHWLSSVLLRCPVTLCDYILATASLLYSLKCIQKRYRSCLCSAAPPGKFPKLNTIFRRYESSNDVSATLAVQILNIDNLFYNFQSRLTEKVRRGTGQTLQEDEESIHNSCSNGIILLVWYRSLNCRSIVYGMYY